MSASGCSSVFKELGAPFRSWGTGKDSPGKCPDGTCPRAAAGEFQPVLPLLFCHEFDSPGDSLPVFARDVFPEYQHPLVLSESLGHGINGAVSEICSHHHGGIADDKRVSFHKAQSCVHHPNIGKFQNFLAEIAVMVTLRSVNPTFRS